MATEKPLKSLHFSKKEAIDFGFETSKKNILFFIALFVIVVSVDAFLGVLQIGLGEKNLFLFLLVSILKMIVGVIISMGVIKITLEFVNGKKPKLSDLLYTKSILNYFIVTLVRSIIVLVGFVFLIVPGIILSIKLQFASYLVVDKNKGVVEALKGSWEMTKGVKWNLFLFWLTLGLINVLGLLALVVGLVVTVPLSMVATAYVYRKLSKLSN